MDMTGQPQLWTPSIEAIQSQAHYVYPEGWTVRYHHRREAQVWADVPAEHYAELSASEAYDVLAACHYGALIGDSRR